jgi:uncharacterized protein YoxC
MFGVWITILLVAIIISLHSVRRAIQAQHETLKSIRNLIDPKIELVHSNER